MEKENKEKHVSENETTQVAGGDFDIEIVRYEDITCPYCGSTDAEFSGNYFGSNAYHCKKCNLNSQLLVLSFIAAGHKNRRRENHQQRHFTENIFHSSDHIKTTSAMWLSFFTDCLRCASRSVRLRKFAGRHPSERCRTSGHILLVAYLQPLRHPWK